MTRGCRFDGEQIYASTGSAQEPESRRAGQNKPLRLGKNSDLPFVVSTLVLKNQRAKALTTNWIGNTFTTSLSLFSHPQPPATSLRVSPSAALPHGRLEPPAP